jgi:lysophospholipase L1-like esterase
MRTRPIVFCAAALASATALVTAATVVSTTVAAAASTRYEAEAAPATCAGTIDSNHTGFSGTGFCNADNAIGAAAQFTVNASAAGTATLGIRFANGTTTVRPADVVVNGSRVAGVSFEGTGAWTTWVTKTLTLSVNSGSNTIRFSPTAADGLANIDYLEVTTADGPTPNPTPCAPPTTSAPPSSSPITVWLAGDSTMADPSGGAVCPAGWGNQFAQYFKSNVTVRNSAIGGRSIQTWLYDPNVTSTKNSAGECVVNPNTYSTRWQAMLNATSGMKAGDYLLIQFGINDGTSACPRHVGSARYQQLLGVMASAAKARGARPVVLTPVAAISCSGSTAVGNRGFITETNSAASANGVPVIDLHRLSYTLYNRLGFCPFNGDYNAGPVGAFFCQDHTHFEAAGARQIAGVVAKALSDQQIPLAAYLK